MTSLATFILLALSFWGVRLEYVGVLLVHVVLLVLVLVSWLTMPQFQDPMGRRRYMCFLRFTLALYGIPILPNVVMLAVLKTDWDFRYVSTTIEAGTRRG